MSKVIPVSKVTPVYVTLWKGVWKMFFFMNNIDIEFFPVFFYLADIHVHVHVPTCTCNADEVKISFHHGNVNVGVCMWASELK